MLKKMQNYVIRCLVWDYVIRCLTLHIKHERRCFINRSKYREDNRKYDAQRNSLDQYKCERDVWIAEETLSRVSFQS